MDIEGIRCHGCGSTNVVFDARRRILKCNQCGKEEYYSRATLNANGKVVFSKQNALRFFKEGKIDDARHYAMDVLNISADHVPAMFILAYYDEFIAGRSDSMHKFFEYASNIALEYDEIKDVRTLALLAVHGLSDFEEDVIELVATNMQSDEDRQELSQFIDSFCPYQISRRSSSSFLTKNLSDMYQELAGHCEIPKTCFALLKSIETNPDSPYADNSFFLKAKVRYFYDNYITEIGKIINAMQQSNIKEKFLNAYNSECKKYKDDANLL